MNNFLESSDGDLLRALLDIRDVQELATGQTLYEAGDHIRFVYFPQSAILSASRTVLNH